MCISVTLYQQSNVKQPQSALVKDDAATPLGISPRPIDDTFDPTAMVTYLFSVKDTGIGIPAEKTNKLFKSFSQVDASTTRNFGGTGITEHEMNQGSMVADGQYVLCRAWFGYQQKAVQDHGRRHVGGVRARHRHYLLL